MLDMDAPKISIEDYDKIHTNVINPLNLYIDVDKFHVAMDKYKYAFRSWGERKKHFLRYGLPLVNKEGNMYNNPEPTCYPLDEWIEGMSPEEIDRNLDRSFTVPTEALGDPAFDSIDIVKPFMLRSCILRWDEPSFFYPHSDTWIPSPILRLWGTSEPEVVKIQFDKQRRRVRPTQVSKLDDVEVEDFVEFEIEPGRLYLMDTSTIHAARSLVDRSTYQFFIALHSDSYSVVDNLRA